MTVLSAWAASLRWTDALDIAALWYVLYRVLLVLRGTRAMQVAFGLMLALALYIASSQLQLYAIHWLLERFFETSVLAVIVLFQADIRRGLAGAGGRLFSGFGSSASQGAVEDIIRASFTMASRRIGALIAIEREASLDAAAENAARLDARVSQELLLAIFFPTSPLHDGAVLVRGDRILAAKAFLNLSLAKDVNRFFGTRHRAAIGLTEETDAVVVLVSEERGTVSLVVAGEVLACTEPGELRDRLAEHLGARAVRRSS